MKKNILSIVALVAAMFVASPAMAQFKYGVKAGLNMTSLNIKMSGQSVGEAISENSDNATGFFAGVMGEFTLPIVGIGVEGSVLYDSKKIKDDGIDKTLNYVSVPINVKYTLGFSSVASAYVATGPQYSWNIGSKNLAGYDLNNSEFSWNIGLGATVLSHYRVGYNYNIALGNTGELDVVGAGVTLATGKLKNLNSHQISITYLF